MRFYKYTLTLILFAHLATQASDIGLITDQMVSTSKPDGGSQFQAIRSNLLFETKESIDSKTSVELSLSDNGFSYFTIHEAKIKINNSFTVGRKIQNWSGIDKQWNTGLIQPNFSFNPLRKVNQGLTGLFYTYKKSNIRFTLFGSGLYIPSQGSSSDVKKGQFIRKSPWFNPPPGKFEFSGREISVFYKIKLPEISEIVQQQSLIASISLENRRFSIKSAIGQKPLNQLALSFDGQLNLSTDRIEAEIIPKVASHSFFAADVEYRAKPIITRLSLFTDQPQNPDFEATKTYQKFTAATIVAPTVEIRGKDIDLGLSYFHREGGDEEEFGKFANSGGTVLPSRFDFRRAVRIYTKGVRGQFSGQLGLTNELVSQSYHIDARAKYVINSQWNALAGFDLVSSVGGGEDLYSTYANGDRVYAGAIYEF